MSPAPLIFDGHIDSLGTVRRAGELLERRCDGHFDLPRAVAGGLGGAVLAIFLPGPAALFEPPVGQALALRQAVARLARLYDLAARSASRVELVVTADQLDRCFEQGRFAAVAHLEGAEPLDTDLAALEVLARAGLRSLGPVWSRPNAFGHGVPFRPNHDPDIGPGLTDAGRRLVRRCNRLGIVVDLSHLNRRGFDDVADLSTAPLVASHSGAWKRCPHARNLTDEQLDAVAASGGIVGCNFASAFLRPPDRPGPAGLDDLVGHIDYMVQRMGIDHVGLGSDFDGADILPDLGDAAGLPRLLEALEKTGYSRQDVHKIACGNWRRVLRRTWGG